VFVAQGDRDVVIPRELLARTWTYLHHESAADVASVRSAGGHSITAPTVEALGAWLAGVVGRPAGSPGE
jgi:phospholipase/carboxylesterase